MIEKDDLTPETKTDGADADGNPEASEIAESTENDSPAEAEQEQYGEDNSPDYGEIAANDLAELKRTFPELREVNDITELNNPMRYAALRDLGLSAEEAYLATNRQRSSYDNRAHLTPSVPGGASVVREMSRNDYDMAREIFSDMSDAEIRKLYRRVTK